MTDTRHAPLLDVDLVLTPPLYKLTLLFPAVQSLSSPLCCISGHHFLISSSLSLSSPLSAGLDTRESTIIFERGLLAPWGLSCEEKKHVGFAWSNIEELHQLMAMKAKETGAPQHHREKSSSAPSTPRTHGRRDSTTDYPPSTPQTHGRRDSTDCELPMLPLKPMPNYLKPTISSGQEICPYANKKPSFETPAMAAKRLTRRRSIDKVPLHPSSQPQKARAPTNTVAAQKEKTTSPAAPLPKPLSVKTPKSVKTTPSPKVAKVPAVAKPRPKEKVVGADGTSKAKKNDHVNSPRDVLARAPKVARDDDGDSADHYEGSGESLAGSERGPRRIKLRAAREGEAMEVESESTVTLKKQDGNGKKESPPSNQVIEEAASKLAGTRRNKVAALVGAFETVISLQEPEPGQQQEAMEKDEAAAAVDGKEGVVAEEAHGWEESETESKVVAKDGEKSADAMLVVEAKEEAEAAKAKEEVEATVEKTVEDDGMIKEANENSEEVSAKLVDGATGSL